METCKYEQVDTSNSRKPFVRQLLVSSGVCVSYFTLGLCTGAPTVIIPQLRRAANSTAAVSDEMASWISSIQGFAAIPWVFILPMLTERCGRKLPFLLISFCTFCSFILFFFSSSVTHILLGEALHGPLNGGFMIINVLIITEYSSPRYRGIFLTLKSATYTWGIWCSNALGTFFDWKTIAILGMFCSAYCIINACFWSESPIWLLSKGYFEKCSTSHRWIKGTDESSEIELRTLIETQKKLQMDIQNKSVTKQIKNFVFSVNFYKPISLAIVVQSLYYFSGKLVCAIYIIDIIKKITGNESTAYTGMLILDGVTVLGMYVGCALSKFAKRRTFLLLGSSIGILFLYLMSLYLYLIQITVITENKYVCIFLLSIFSMAICSGPMLMCPNIIGELIPLRFRSFSVFVVSLYNSCMFGTIVKIAPYLFKTLKLHGTFLFYGIISSIFMAVLYKYLPETKDMTLLEIEKYIKTNSKEENEHNERELIET